MQPRPYHFFRKQSLRRLSACLFFFILIEGLFSFCSKTTCPAFADAMFDSWFPYTANQAIVFTAANGTKDTITVSDIYRSPEQQQYGRPADCNAYASVASYVTPTALRFYINYDTYAAGNSLSIQLNDFWIGGATLSEQQITVADSSARSSLLTSVVIAGKTFGPVVQLQRDTTAVKTAGFYKMWFSKGAGLVGYEHYPSLQQWAKE
jgi:hypothetical protein